MVSTFLCSCCLSSVRPQASCVCIWRINFCTVLLAILLVELAVSRQQHDIICTAREKKKPKNKTNRTPPSNFQRKEKRLRHFLPSWNVNLCPAPRDVCVPGLLKLDLMPAPEQQLTMHMLEEKWLRSLRRSLLCFALTAERICAGL